MLHTGNLYQTHQRLKETAMVTWREYFRPMIAAIIRENKELPLPKLKRLLSSKNPGVYHHQRRIWGNEYMAQLGLCKLKRLPNFVPENQISIFTESQ